MGGNLPLWSSMHVNADLYAWALTSAYRHGIRIYEPSPANRDDADAYEKALRDPVIRQAVDQRLRSVAGRRWRVVAHSDRPNDRAAAKIVEDAFKLIREFTEARYISAKAIFTGRSHMYIEGQRSLVSLGDYEGLDWWVITGLKEVDYRRFRYAPIQIRQPNGQDMTMVREEMWSWSRAQWEAIREPENFLKVIYNDEESRLSYGRGLLEAMHFYLWIKGIILRDGLQGARRWSQGLIKVKIDGAREASTDRQNDDIASEWLNVMKKHVSENFLVQDKLDEVDVLETSGTGHQIISFFLEYLDQGLMRLINGSILPNGAGSDTGSNARAQTEAGNSEAISQFDRDKIDDNITSDLIGQFWRLNRRNFAACGLLDARMPHFEAVQESREDANTAVQVITGAINAGIDLRRDEVYSRLGFTRPQEGDDVIAGRAAPEPGLLGGGFPEAGSGAPGATLKPSDKPEGPAGPPKPSDSPVEPPAKPEQAPKLNASKEKSAPKKPTKHRKGGKYKAKE